MFFSCLLEKQLFRRSSSGVGNFGGRPSPGGGVFLPHYGIEKHLAVFGQRPRYGTKSCRMGRFSVRSSVRPSVRPFVRPSPPSRAQEPARQALDPARQASEPARQASEPARQALELLTNGRTNERTNGRTNGKSPHSTGLHPLSGPLPKKC